MILKNLLQVPAIAEAACHGGIGTVRFRRVLQTEFQSSIAFLDYTEIPPGATIGYHEHRDSEEFYVILEGTGEMRVNGEVAHVKSGDVILNPRGGWHGLANTGASELRILVVEGRIEPGHDRTGGSA